MKNARIQPLVILTFVFVLFVLGLFYKRTQNHTPVNIQKLPPPTVFVEDSAISAESTLPPIININTATSDQLQSLPGIGQTLADRIILYREQHGDYESVGALMHVEGIGTTKLETIWDLVTVGG